MDMSQCLQLFSLVCLIGGSVAGVGDAFGSSNDIFNPGNTWNSGNSWENPWQPDPWQPRNPWDSWPGVNDGFRKDCRWLAWKGKICTRKIDGSFVIKQTRKKIKAKRGGRDCIQKHSTREIPCKVTYFIAHKFLQTITEYAIAGGSGPSFRRELDTNPFRKPNYRNPCAEDVADEEGLRMVGKKCDTKTRKRRNAEGKWEEYEEMIVPLAPRKKRGADEDGGVKTTNHRDLLFMVDESGSVGSVNFDKAMNMVKAVTDSLCGSISVGLHTTRVGVMTFNRYQKARIDFDRYFDKMRLGNALRQIRYSKDGSGATCMVDALDFTKTDMFTSKRGSRIGKDSVERLVIMITDGCANCEGWTQAAGHTKFSEEKAEAALKKVSSDLAASKISVVTFYIGPDDKCVNRIRGLADGSHCYQVFAAKSWTEFEEITRGMTESDCMDAWTVGEKC